MGNFSVSGGAIQQGSGTANTAGNAAPGPVVGDTAPLNTTNFYQDADGNWHPLLGVDTTTADVAGSGPPAPIGTPTVLNRIFLRDTQRPTQTVKNAFVSINHQSVVGTANTNQDRALGIVMSNVTGNIQQFSITNNVLTLVVNNITSGVASNADRFRLGQTVVPSGLAVGTYLNGVSWVITATVLNTPSAGYQTLTLTSAGFNHANVGLTSDTGLLDQSMYSMACIQAELDIAGVPQISVGAPDNEYTAGSFQLSDSHIAPATGHAPYPNLGANAIRCQFFRNGGTDAWGSTALAGSAGRFRYTNSSAVAGAGAAAVGVHVEMFNAAAPPSLTGMGVRIERVSSTRFPTNNYGLYIGDYGTNNADYSIYSAGGQSYFTGPVTIGKFAVASLPTGQEGQIAYATNGRKVGEGAGSGTGVPVYFSNGQWRAYSTDATVTA